MKVTMFSVLILALVLLMALGRAADAQSPQTEGYTYPMPHLGVLSGESSFDTGALPARGPTFPLSFEPDYDGTFTYQIEVGLLPPCDDSLRKPRIWRLLHYGSFAVYLLVTAHGPGAGSDAAYSRARKPRGTDALRAQAE